MHNFEMTILKVHGLWKSFGSRDVLKGVGLSIGEGELFTLVGENGVGKTTLVKCVVGVLEPDRGSIEVGGEDVTYAPPSRRGIGVVFQGSPLLPLKYVYEHIGFPLLSEGVSSDDRIREVASLLGIEGLLDKRLNSLSGGERQKVAIATALVRDPSVLVLDEPFSNLDIEYRMMLYNLLLDLKSRGVSILLVTHIIDDIVYLSDRLGVMHDGRIVESGEPDRLLRTSANYFTHLILREPLTSILYIDGGNAPLFVKKFVSGNGGKCMAVVSYDDVRVYRDRDGEGVVIGLVRSGEGRNIAVVRLGGGGVVYGLTNGDVCKGDIVSIDIISDIKIFDIGMV